MCTDFMLSGNDYENPSNKGPECYNGAYAPTIAKPEKNKEVFYS